MRTCIMVALVVAAISVTVSPAVAAVPGLINLQGKLTDASNNPLPDASYSVTFRIYDEDAGGAVLWSEVSSVTTADGLFTTNLGAVTPVPDSVFNNPDRWLGIQVQGFAEMTPRTRLTSVAYSNATAQWNSVGPNLTRLNGNVGIGTPDPISKLHIATDASDLPPRVQSPGTTSLAAGWNFYHGASSKGFVGVPDPAQGFAPGEMLLYGSSGTKTSLWAGGSRGVTIGTDGNVGIGTPSPEAKLHVGGGAAAVLLDNSGAVFWKSSAGVATPVLTLWSDDDVYLDARGSFISDLIFRTSPALTERMRITGEGYVGIGTTPDPLHQLHVQTARYSAVNGHGTFPNGIGVRCQADNGSEAAAVYGTSSSGYAGYFSGKVHVTGTLTKSAGSFKIDHPLDPANKSLSHSFVESPDMMNIYNGNVTLDSRGEAVVTLPDWFGALNKDFRYQLTCIGGFAPVYVAEEVTDNRFRIAGGSTGTKVSWQVTGIRQDAYANAHRIPVEESKPEKERGFYMNPELFGQPEEKGVDWARRPEMMKQMKDEREKADAESS